MVGKTTALVGGLVADGTGATSQRATVIIENGVVSDVVKSSASLASDIKTIDCTDLVVAPGFIDSHSHADNAPLLVDDDVSKIEQGVTTEITGNCGFSLAPIDPFNKEAANTLLERIFPPMDFSWAGFDEYLATLESRKLITNHAPLVGHNVLRIAAMGADGRKAEPFEIRRMVSELEKALEAGAFGMSSGLIYPPGLFSAPSELRALTEALGHQRVYATHMRNESSRVFESISESLSAVGKHCRLHVSHVKISDPQQWGRMGEYMAALDRAREDGQDVYQDAYPYSAGSTMLTATLPPWFHDGGEPAILSRLESRSTLDRALEDIENDRSYENMVIGGWDKVVVSSTRSHRYEGHSLTELANQFGTSPFEALIRVLREEQLKATMVVHFMHEDDVRDGLRHPLTAIGSDGLPPGTGGRPHPRTFGTFPRVLGHYAQKEKLFSLEEAIRRMTQLPAKIFGLNNRGIIRRGAIADIVVFDPNGVVDTATYEQPTSRPIGIEKVYQGGHLVVSEGKWQGVRHGRRLKAN
ncbi:amidohydrolase family protein [Brevibacterium paucivorans]|uniref:N-acyl-D-amino-acid deacylase family protein n=1 Tax=Brevibacterium paucivorans TaxID=170994 RepID=UPI0031E17F19